MQTVTDFQKGLSGMKRNEKKVAISILSLICILTVTLFRNASFSEDFVFYYGLKLKLISRLKQFDVEAGTSAYRNIYNSILGGDELEVK